jgi:hypothetical protein
MQDALQKTHDCTPRENRPVAASRGPHLVVLAACSSIVIAAFFLVPSGDTITFGRFTFPTICTFRQATGVPCPGCGLTRSVVAATHGDWSASYRYNRLGPIVLLYLMMQILYRIAWLFLEPLRAGISRAGRVIDTALIPLMVVLFLNWIPTLIGTFRGTQ